MLLLIYSLTRKNFHLFASSLIDELLMLGLGITGGSLYFLTENTALNYTTTTNTSLIVCLCPLFAALLLSVFYKSERLNRTQAIGSLIAAVGVIIVVLNGRFVLHLSPKGDSLAFAACMCWAVYSLLMKPANQRYDVVFITRKVFFYGLASMELVDEKTGRSHHYQLRISQPRSDHPVCMDDTGRAYNSLFPAWHSHYSCRNVPCRPQEIRSPLSSCRSACLRSMPPA